MTAIDIPYVSTYRGDKIPISQMSHQHVSNWIHYSTWVVEDTEAVEFFNGVLTERFNGELLEYRPHVNYDYELVELYRKGMLDIDGGVRHPKTNIKIGQVQV